MEAQQQEHVNEILKSLITSIKDAKDLAKEELPLVAKELLDRDLLLAKIDLKMSALCILINICVSVGCAAMSHLYQGDIGTILFGIVSGLSLFFALMYAEQVYASYIKIISIKTAPKVYLLEKLNILK